MAQAPLVASILIAMGAMCFSFMGLFAKKAGTQGHLSCFVILAVRSSIGLVLNWGAVFASWFRARRADKKAKAMATAATLTPSLRLQRRGSTGSKASVDSEAKTAEEGSIFGLPRRVIVWLAVRSFAGFGCVLLEYAALRVLPLKVSAMIIYSSPAFIVLWAALLLGERISRAVVALQLVSFSGLVVVVRPWTLGEEGSAPVWSYIATVIGTSLAGLAYVSLRALAGTDYLTVMSTFLWVSLVCSVGVAVPMGAFNLPGADLKVWGFLIAVGVFAYIAEVCVTCGYQRAGAGTGQVSVFKFLSPVCSMLWGCLFLAEEIEWTDLAGAALILGSSATIVILQTKGHKHAKGDDTPKAEASPNPDMANPTFEVDLESDNPSSETCPECSNPEAREYQEVEEQHPSFCLTPTAKASTGDARSHPEDASAELNVAAI
uniref:EamA domain-containing protein n=1 Tax=Alexandrium catenella TaxID=2925 RepID=A0A7S1RA31_ALECA